MNKNTIHCILLLAIFVIQVNVYAWAVVFLPHTRTGLVIGLAMITINILVYTGFLYTWYKICLSFLNKRCRQWSAR